MHANNITVFISKFTNYLPTNTNINISVTLS